MYPYSPQSPLAESPERIDETLEAAEIAKAEGYFLPRAEDRNLATMVKTAGDALYLDQPGFACRDLTFVTDFPDKGEANRRVFTMISALLEDARQEIWVETPYFVIKEGGYALLERARDNGVRIRMLSM